MAKRAAKRKGKAKRKTFNPRGRPTKLTPELAIRINYLARHGSTEEEICKFINISRSTLSLWKKDPEFSDAIKSGKAEADKLVELSLFEKATGYTCPEQKVFQYEGTILTHDMVRHHPPSDVAIIFWLKNRMKKQWRDKQEVDLGGKLGVEGFIEEAHKRALEIKAKAG